MIKVVCPYCEAEYSVQEIFLMNTFNNLDVIKDENGKILDDIVYDTEESYKCDFCNKTFFAKMDIKIEISTQNIDSYVTKLHKPALFFKED